MRGIGVAVKKLSDTRVGTRDDAFSVDEQLVLDPAHCVRKFGEFAVGAQTRRVQRELSVRAALGAG